MTEILGGELPIEVFEMDAGLVCVKQKSATGEEQTILLKLDQMERLASWLIQYAQTDRENLAEE